MDQNRVQPHDRLGRYEVAVARHPIFPALAAVPLICFAGALLTDWVYARSPDMQWANFSAWLITFGLIFAFFATIVGVIDFLRNPRTGRSILHIALVLTAYVVALFNIFVHSRDAYTSVVPAGLTLSIIAVVLLTVGNFLGAGLRYRRSYGDAA